MEETSKQKEGKYLTFDLGNEQYGIGILSVKEIIGMMEITAVPQMPSYAKGVINLRGQVIPVIDLRSKFMMPEAEYTERTCIIVVETAAMAGTTRDVGIVVDGVSEVLHIKEEQIEDAPSLGTQVESQSILGMAKEASGVKILLDIDKALDGSPVTAMAEAA